jgi:dolichyl-phosphate beta-glucosyltransferase
MSQPQQPIVLVVPCFNEAQRLDVPAFVAMLDHDPSLSLLFVDDGSSDQTVAVHTRMQAERPGRIEAMALGENRGKAEAVRLGLLRSLQGTACFVGYVDADMATPGPEVERLCTVLRESPDCDVLLGSRVRMMGRSIDRRPLRHYLGRAFATAASLVLRLPVYDTQCGAKLFRRTAALEHALSQPFLSRWIFDVELLSRLLMGAPGIPLIPANRVREEPLQRWADREGSRLGPLQMLRSGLDLGRIEIAIEKRRRCDR